MFMQMRPFMGSVIQEKVGAGDGSGMVGKCEVLGLSEWCILSMVAIGSMRVCAENRLCC